MIMNMDTVLSIMGAALGFLGAVSALFAMRAVRGWRARGLMLESSMAALRRELELAASTSVETGRQGRAHRAGVFERGRPGGSG